MNALGLETKTLPVGHWVPSDGTEAAQHLAALVSAADRNRLHATAADDFKRGWLAVGFGAALHGFASSRAGNFVRSTTDRVAGDFLRTYVFYETDTSPYPDEMLARHFDRGVHPRRRCDATRIRHRVIQSKGACVSANLIPQLRAVSFVSSPSL